MFSQLQLFQKQTILDANSLFTVFSQEPGNLASDDNGHSLETEIPDSDIPLYESAVQLFLDY